MIVLVAQQAVMTMTIKFFVFILGSAVCQDTDRTATAAPPFLNVLEYFAGLDFHSLVCSLLVLNIIKSLRNYMYYLCYMDIIGSKLDQSVIFCFLFFWGVVCQHTDRTATAASPFLNALSGDQIQLDILNEISWKTDLFLLFE